MTYDHRDHRDHRDQIKGESNNYLNPMITQGIDTIEYRSKKNRI